jgi:hypothetical protein
MVAQPPGGGTGGVSVIAVLACRLLCTSSAVRVPSLAIPGAPDEGRDQDGIIKGPSAGSSSEAAMRAILAAAPAGAFPPRLTGVEACLLPADRHRKDVMPTLRKCFQQAHTMVHPSHLVRQ